MDAWQPTKKRMSPDFDHFSKVSPTTDAQSTTITTTNQHKKGVFLSGDLYRKLTDACPETENGGILVRVVYTRHLVAVLLGMAFCAYTGRGVKCVGFSGPLEPPTGHTRHRHIQLTFNNPNEHPKTNPKRCSLPSAGPRRGSTATQRRSPSRSQAGGAWNGSTMGPRTRTRAVGCL